MQGDGDRRRLDRDHEGPGGAPARLVRESEEGMADFVETYRGVVYPWDCDHLGHMNVKNYVGMFDQAGFHFLSMIGFSMGDMQETGVTLVDARHTIEYKREQRVGSLVLVQSAITKLGNKSLTMLHRMSNIETGDLAATSEIVTVCFDLKARASIPIPDDRRKRMQKFVVEA
jgi:acyl-CoA thioester hydrolase